MVPVLYQDLNHRFKNFVKHHSYEDILMNMDGNTLCTYERYYAELNIDDVFAKYKQILKPLPGTISEKDSMPVMKVISDVFSKPREYLYDKPKMWDISFIPNSEKELIPVLAVPVPEYGVGYLSLCCGDTFMVLRDFGILITNPIAYSFIIPYIWQVITDHDGYVTIALLENAVNTLKAAGLSSKALMDHKDIITAWFWITIAYIEVHAQDDPDIKIEKF